MKRLIISLAVIAAGVLFLSIAPLAHAEDVFEGACQGAAASSAVCQSGQGAQENPLVGPNGLITRVTQIVVLIVGVAAVITIIISGLRYVTSAGDSAGVNNAKNGILYAVVGLVVAVIGQVIITLVLQKL